MKRQYLDLDRLRTIVRERYELALPACGPDLAEGITREVVAGYDIDQHQFVHAHVLRFINESARRRVAGRRVAEIIRLDSGLRQDAVFEQLTIRGAEVVARRKIGQGEATIATGLSDLAVVNAATVAAARAGLDLTTTKIEDVLSAEEIAELRGDEKAA